ncbi:MAG: NAD(P)(+) transhydrogenase (Re/Si-specific) subunit beta [Thermoflavifilum aggregans]|nr:NAD(P)(+) transhydrogenase (Re/Si-specific) subunit beta [Thermoflavifilum aggregans]
MGLAVLSLCYLIGSVTFIVGLKMLSHPRTARRGNLVAATGMGIAIVGTIFLYQTEDGTRLHNYGWIFSGLIIGGIIGTVLARKVKMTAMPEMVSLFNGMGGLCAALISVNEFEHLTHADPLLFVAAALFSGQNLLLHVFIILAGLVIGSISFSGSMIALGKLAGKIGVWRFQGQQVLNISVLVITLLLAVGLLTQEAFFNGWVFGLIMLLALVYGILFVMPIGGADMPVVISVLNSCTGIAAACGGFLYDNQVMLTGGILVGSAGAILTVLMCKAMNRSLKNVLLGSFGGVKSGQAAQAQQSYKEITVSDAAVVLAYAKKVMIVPGYGLAVAQAQHTCHELEKLLEERGVEVKYAIHPVAGRMPGHMNVLLAEADVPYEKLLEMEQANSEFETTDAVLVLGANDVVNPAAKEDPGSPIYGMPVLEVEKAGTIIVNKRSMKPGYAGIENMLFYRPKTAMLFGDAKQTLQQLIQAIKEL